MIFSGKRICFIGAHPDDIELGCGALIGSLQDKESITCVTLSDNQKNPLLVNLVKEYSASMSALGILTKNTILEKFETRRFPAQRQDILEYLIKLNRTLNPDIVFVHTRSDLHQDHNTVTEECLRAFRSITVLGYDVIRSSYGFFPNLLTSVSESDVKQKIDALAQYKTYSGKYYFDPEVTRATLIRNGALCECKYAEGFETLRIIGTFQ
jgi:LmbE family N-acetylglucosaminyl deacetylase